MIILAGSNSIIGKYLVPKLRSIYPVCAFDKERGNIKDHYFVEKLIEEIQPDIFINCMQYNNVEECELYREEAYNVNSFAVKNIAELCAQKNIKLLQISSTYVYDGNNKNEYSERSALKPQTVYGDSLAYGEELIQSSGVDYLVLRIPELFGNKGSYIQKFIDSVKNKSEYIIVKDQQVSIIDAILLTKCILMLLKNNVTGVYNLAARQSVNKKELLSFFLEKYNNYNNKDYNANIIEKPFEEIISICDEQPYCNLSLDKISKINEIKICDWRKIVNNYFI